MRKGIALFATLLVVASVFGSTQVWTSVSNSGGLTEYSETSTVAGLDWSEGKTWQTTGVVNFAVNNDGKLQLNTYVSNPSAWVLEKYESVVGEGDSEIYKQLAVWTEDTTLVPGTVSTLKWPTEAFVSADFVTNTMSDHEVAYFLMDVAPAETNVGVFTKQIYTSDLFNFDSAQGIGIEPCNPVSAPQFEPVQICVKGLGILGQC